MSNPSDAPAPRPSAAAGRRKLTVIMSADIAGYSRLMGEDEDETLRALGGLKSIVEEEVAAAEGRVFSSAGDGFMAEFVSAADAVMCALAFQQRVATANKSRPPTRQMLFRVGVNLADVVVVGRDLFGDGVNIAARLQTLAEPGGICVSSTVYEQLRKRKDLRFSSLGPQQVKNIAEPVTAFRVSRVGQATPGTAGGAEPPSAALTVAADPPPPLPLWILTGVDANGAPVKLPLMRAALLGHGLTIGRQHGASDLTVVEPTVSRRHLRLFLKDEALMAEDLGSSNGTAIDGLRLAPGSAARLRDGAEVRLGHLALTLRPSR